MFRDLLFFGYHKGEYPLKSNAELRGARTAFEYQIKFATVFSFILCVIDIVSIICVVIFSTVGEFAKNWSLHIEMGIVLLVLIFTFTSIKSKITCVIQVILFGISTVLMLLFGNAGSVFMCLIGTALYIKIYFAHVHLGYIKSRGDIDNMDQIREVISGTGEMRADLKKAFSDYEKGGVNPFNKQVNHEAIFNNPVEEEQKKPQTEIFTDFSKEELDAILGKSKNQQKCYAFDGAYEINVTEGECDG